MSNNHLVLYNYYSKYYGGSLVPNLVEIDIEFNWESKKGGLNSEAIARKVKEKYKKGMRNYIQDKPSGKMFKFDIIPYNKDNYEPLYDRGSFTAVYIIKDKDNKINDSIDNTYILRLASRIDKSNMFNNPKIKLEYKLFNEYLSKIYYYGSVPGLKFASERGYDKPSIIDYNITKKYNTYDYENPNKLTNQQKYNLLLSNLDMLHTLSANNYVHTDYKIDNIGWEDNEIMNVVLIDFDFNTLLKLDENDTRNFTKEGGKIILKKISTTFYSRYLSSSYEARYKQYTYDVETIRRKGYTDVNQYNKYSIGGLINVIETLNIEFNFNKLEKNDPPYFINISDPDFDEQFGPGKFSIKKIDASNIIISLGLTRTEYELIPTYEQLYKLFLELGQEGHIKDVKV